MITLEEKQNIVTTFRENVAELLTKDSLLTQGKPAELVENTDSITYYIRNTVLNSVLSALPVGSHSVDPIVRVTITENSIGTLIANVAISSRKNSPVVFKGKRAFAGANLTPARLVEFFESVILQAITALGTSENLEAVNDVLVEAVQAAELPFSISFIAEDEKSGRGIIDHISNDEIVFVANTRETESRIPRLTLFLENEEVPEGEQTRQERAKEMLVEELRGIETPIELLKAKVDLVNLLAGIRTHSPVTMVRASVSRKIEGVRPTVKKDIKAVVETDEVIGLVERVDGVWSELLTPFNKTTNEPSDFDIVAEAERIVALA